MTDDALAGITADDARALMSGATPGPWRADGEPWNRIVWSQADNRVCFMTHSSGLNDARDIATSNLVAASPDLARTVIAQSTELAALHEEVGRLRGMVAEAERRGMERAAVIALNACLVEPDGGSPSVDERLVCEEAHDRIMAVAATIKVKP